MSTTLVGQRLADLSDAECANVAAAGDANPFGADVPEYMRTRVLPVSKTSFAASAVAVGWREAGEGLYVTPDRLVFRVI